MDELRAMQAKDAVAAARAVNRVRRVDQFVGPTRMRWISAQWRATSAS
jgi:hypothetical protein